MEEGRYLNMARPKGPCLSTIGLLPEEWSRAVKAVSRLVSAGKWANPALGYVEAEYHDEVTFLAATNGWSALVLELPPVEGLSGYARLPIDDVKSWLKDKDNPDVLIMHDQDADYPDLRSVFPTTRFNHEGGDLGMSVELLHQVLTAIRDVKPQISRYQPTAWQVAASTGDRLSAVYFRSTGVLSPKDEGGFLIHALLMPLRLE